MIREIHKNIIVVGDFFTLLSTMDRSSRHKINKVTLELNYTLNQKNLRDIYRTFHPTMAEYTWNILQDIICLGHQTSFNKYKKIEIISSIFYEHNDMKLQIGEKPVVDTHRR